MSDDEGLRRVAKSIRQRRLELGRTQQQAASSVGLSGTTWRQAEKYANPVSDLSQFAITRALGWRSDAFAVIADGGVPPLEADDEPPLRIEFRTPVAGEDAGVAVSRDLTKMIAESDAEEGVKALEAALGGRDPVLSALAGATWDLSPQDKAAVLEVAQAIRRARRGFDSDDSDEPQTPSR